MIGVDTNVLIRANLEDDPEQTKEAKRFLKKASENKMLFISSFAILEMVWVMKVNGCTREEICESVLDLVDSPGIMVGKREIIIAALEKYAKGKADFADYLIFTEGEFYGALKMASFDKGLCKEHTACQNPGQFFNQ